MTMCCACFGVMHISALYRYWEQSVSVHTIALLVLAAEWISSATATSQLNRINKATQLHLISSAITTSQLSCNISAHLQQSVSLCAQVQHYLLCLQCVA